MNLHVKYVERKCRIKDGLKLQKSIKFDNDGKDEEDFDDKDTNSNKDCKVSLKKFTERLNYKIV